MARRRNYYSSSGNSANGCIAIVAGLVMAVTALLEWIKENPTLTIMIILGVLIFIYVVMYIIKEFKNSDANNLNSRQTIIDSIHSKKTYESYQPTYQQSNNVISENIVKQEYKPITEEQVITKEEKEVIVDILSCSKNDILTLDGFNNKKAKKFIKERANGKMWYDLDSFVKDFDLQPHEMILIQDKIKFPERPKNRYGRKLDI